MIATDEVIDMTPENLARVFREMLAGVRVEAVFRLRASQVDTQPGKAAARGALLMLAEKVLR